MYADTFRFTDAQLRDAFFHARTAAVPAADPPRNDTLRGVVRRLRGGDPGPDAGWWVLVDVNGGAVADVGAGATAFAQRDALYYFQVYVSSRERAIGEAGFGFAEGVMGKLRRGRGYGVYPGYPEDRLASPQEKYWGGNLPRLERLKAVFDPEDVFGTPHGVKPVRL